MSADDELGMLDTFKPFPKTPPKKFPRLPPQPPKTPLKTLKKRNGLRKPPKRVPLSVRVSENAFGMLLAVQTTYAARMGEGPPVSQSKAVELMITETFKRENTL